MVFAGLYNLDYCIDGGSWFFLARATRRVPRAPTPSMPAARATRLSPRLPLPLLLARRATTARSFDDQQLKSSVLREWDYVLASH